jgi:monofunctional glycosyltransferase
MATKKQAFIVRAFRFCLKLALILFVSANLYLILCKWVMPPITITQAAAFFEGYGLKRNYVNNNEISAHVKLAAIASEDQLFTDHSGFDWKAIDKSLNAPKKKHRPQGSAASTISQQTAKNVFLWQGSGISRYIRKLPEFYFTYMIELVWGKTRIMEVYLNVIEMGPGIFGIDAAAHQYFRKTAAAISRAEAAQLIACLPNPKHFTVRPMSRRVSWRYPQIMQQMNNLEGDEDVQALLKGK